MKTTTFGTAVNKATEIAKYIMKTLDNDVQIAAKQAAFLVVVDLTESDMEPMVPVRYAKGHGFEYEGFKFPSAYALCQHLGFHVGTYSAKKILDEEGIEYSVFIRSNQRERYESLVAERVVSRLDK